jgi:LysR family nitrogen assimilation transcriptional regulator
MMELSGKVLGKIAVGIIPSITNSVLADVLHHFGAKYPDVEIRIDEAYSGTLIDWVVAGDLDFAVVNRTRRKTDVSMHPLIDEELVLVERGKPKNNLEPIPFARLKQLDLVLPSRRHGLRNIVDHAAEEIGIQITPRVEVDALGPTLKLVSESGLTTVLPAIVARRSTRELPVRTRRIIEPVLKRQLVYVFRSQRRLSRIFMAFIDILSEELKRGAAPSNPPRHAASANR